VGSGEKDERGLWRKDSLVHFEEVLRANPLVFHHSRDPKALRNRLQELLEQGKWRGRNRVCCFLPRRLTFFLSFLLIDQLSFLDEER